MASAGPQQNVPINLNNLTPQQLAQLQQLQQMQMRQQQQQAQNLPKPDAHLQAVIEASHIPVDITLADPSNSTARCTAHKLEKCDDCGVDFLEMNRLARLFVANPQLNCPPPPTVVTKQLSQVVNQTKEEGNV
jgi:translocation protein SEC72